jgi:phytoene dehydrogenase-like protein
VTIEARVADYDAVIVGSGINSLAAGALLARGGWRVAVLERNEYLGGAVRTAELTLPGYRHDVFSAWHPLWVGGAAHATLGPDLEQRGLEYLNTDLPTATVYPDGESAFLLRTTDENAQELDRFAPGDGAAWRRTVDEFLPNADLSFGVLATELYSRAGAGLGLRAARRLGVRGAVEFVGELLVSARHWLEGTFESERAHGLLAPWVLHTGLGPDAAASGYMAKVIGIAVQEGGMPIPRGGGDRLVDALTGVITDNGGACLTGQDVERVLAERGRAIGVRLVGGETVTASRAVLANVTPAQLHGRLLADNEAPARVREGGSRFRFGRSEMQIHFALSEPPRWAGDERLERTAVVHVTPGLDGVSRAVNEAERGLLPAEATIVVGQPLTMDPSRAPEGMGLLWIQLQELPWHVKGDAAGGIETGNGTWTHDLRERYADRIQARLARHMPNLDSAVQARVTLSPADLAEVNINLEQGDPYSGSLALDQSFLWRPFPAQPGHATHVDGLFHIGASTHPGPGLGAGSGTLVAQQLLRPSLAARAAARARTVAGR